MIVKRKGGMTELIPTPTEKREAIVRDHVLDLLEILDRRIRRIEESFGLSSGEAEDFADRLERLRAEERSIEVIQERIRQQSAKVQAAEVEGNRGLRPT